MRNGGSPVLIIVLGAVVLCGGAVAGYYYMGAGFGARDAPRQAQPIAPPALPAVPPAAAVATVHRPVEQAGDYTAPGAPNIEITETQVPVKPKPPPPAPQAAAVQTAQAATAGSTDVGAGAQSPPAAQPGSAATDGGAPGADQGATSGQAGAAANPAPPAPAAPPTSPAPPVPDASPGSPGAAPWPTFSGGLFHVQAGAFESEKNAKILEDALRHKGYAAITMPKSSGLQQTYVVQVGAYGSRVTADEVVASLERDGFPASVSSGQ